MGFTAVEADDVEGKCQWTARQQTDWMKKREEYRSKKGLPPLATLYTKDLKGYLLALELERKTLLARLDALIKKTVSWPVHSYPMAEYNAPFAGILHLPNHYREKHGSREIPFSKGQNLNAIVYNFYEKKVPPDYPGDNFVSNDGLVRRRHEYLGPSPRVAGFCFNKQESSAVVEWYDDHLHTKWVGNNMWMIEARYDENVSGWLSKPRGDFYNSLDRQEYLGLEG